MKTDNKDIKDKKQEN